MLIRESGSPSRQDGEAIAEDSEFASVTSSELDPRRRADRGTGAHEMESSALADPHGEQSQIYRETAITEKKGGVLKKLTDGRLASLKVSN